jgi:hypothetical protein
VPGVCVVAMSNVPLHSLSSKPARTTSPTICHLHLSLLPALPA